MSLPKISNNDALIIITNGEEKMITNINNSNKMKRRGNGITNHSNQ